MILDSIGDLLLMPILQFVQQSALQQFLLSSHHNSQELFDLLVGLSALHNGCQSDFIFLKKGAKSQQFTLIK